MASKVSPQQKKLLRDEGYAGKTCITHKAPLLFRGYVNKYDDYKNAAGHLRAVIIFRGSDAAIPRSEEAIQLFVKTFRSQ
jgi:hypothetical protein